MTSADVRQVLFGTNQINSGSYLDAPNTLISAILPTFYIVAGFILFLYLVFGGFTIVASSGDAKKN